MPKNAHDRHTTAGAAATELIRTIFLLDAILIAEGDRLARDLGLTSARWQVLAAAAERPKSVPQLARRMNLSRQSVQRLVELMAKSGFVRLIDNPDHVRAKLVEVTDKGLQARAKLQARQVSWVNDASRSFSCQELDAARGILQRLHGAFEQTERRSAKNKK